MEKAFCSRKKAVKIKKIAKEIKKICHGKMIYSSMQKEERLIKEDLILRKYRAELSCP
jgi:hypothetical protein